ncbi:unnamed protein product [Soboliphyme baturini]|uniref:Pre-mRNA-splicing factor 38B n=1 Tax=Soboliphyme baturini TaxID=241478 RepID=A0A183J6S4_9BILA|nr:unnamed protein product [Soboliphyme baturini]
MYSSDDGELIDSEPDAKPTIKSSVQQVKVDNDAEEKEALLRARLLARQAEKGKSSKHTTERHHHKKRKRHRTPDSHEKSSSGEVLPGTHGRSHRKFPLPLDREDSISDDEKLLGIKVNSEPMPLGNIKAEPSSRRHRKKPRSKSKVYKEAHKAYRRDGHGCNKDYYRDSSKKDGSGDDWRKTLTFSEELDNLPSSNKSFDRLHGDR